MEKYKKIKKLGQGASGIVWKAKILNQAEREALAAQEDDLFEDDAKRTPQSERKRKRPGNPDARLEEGQHGDYVAIKKIMMKNGQDGLCMEAVREIKLLPELQHENVTRVLDIFNHGSNVSVVLEFMPEDLAQIINDKENIVLSPADVKSYMKMLLSGVAYIHSHWVLHRDLKPANLLIGGGGVLKLADFGLAKVYGSPNRDLTNQTCTLWYRAPELLFGAKAYGAASDMWSVGCIFAELIQRDAIFKGTSELSQLARIFALLGTPTEVNWPGVSTLPNFAAYEATPPRNFREIFHTATDDALDLLSSLLVLDPKQRISAEDALGHPYFGNVPAPTQPNKLPRTKKFADES